MSYFVDYTNTSVGGRIITGYRGRKTIGKTTQSIWASRCKICGDEREYTSNELARKKRTQGKFVCKACITTTCPRCTRTLPENHFAAWPSRYNGLAPYCRDCMKEIAAEKHTRQSVRKQYRIARSLRSRIWYALTNQGATKSNTTEEICGATFEELTSYLKALFQPGMS